MGEEHLQTWHVLSVHECVPLGENSGLNARQTYLHTSLGILSKGTLATKIIANFGNTPSQVLLPVSEFSESCQLLSPVESKHQCTASILPTLPPPSHVPHLPPTYLTSLPHTSPLSHLTSLPRTSPPSHVPHLPPTSPPSSPSYLIVGLLPLFPVFSHLLLCQLQNVSALDGRLGRVIGTVDGYHDNQQCLLILYILQSILNNYGV